MLRERGIPAWALRGGLAAWRRAGYPTEPKAVEQATQIEDVCPECGRPMAEHAVPTP
jgi:3-mercaptopyruvate sulfurtransferase SseA